MLSATMLTATPPWGVRVTVLFAATGSNPVPVIWTLMPADAPSGATALNATAARIGASKGAVSETANATSRPRAAGARRVPGCGHLCAAVWRLEGLRLTFNRGVRFRGGGRGATDRESRAPCRGARAAGFRHRVRRRRRWLVIEAENREARCAEFRAERSGFAEEIEEDGRRCRERQSAHEVLVEAAVTGDLQPRNVDRAVERGNTRQ